MLSVISHVGIRKVHYSRALPCHLLRLPSGWDLLSGKESSSSAAPSILCLVSYHVLLLWPWVVCFWEGDLFKLFNLGFVIWFICSFVSAFGVGFLCLFVGVLLAGLGFLGLVSFGGF